MDEARRCAHQVLMHIREKRSHADEVLDKTFRRKPKLTPLDRAFVYEIVMGVLRWNIRIDWIIKQISKIDLNRMERRVLEALRMGIYQAIFMDRVPSYAVVNETVNLLERKEERGFVNACLRRFLEMKEKIRYPDPVKDPLLFLSIYYSFPLWMVKKLYQIVGRADISRLLEALNEQAPLCLRVNTLKIKRDDFVALLKEKGYVAANTMYSPDGVIFASRMHVREIPGYNEGYFSVQDEASQLISYMLGVKEGDTVLDICAAPGVKTTHLAALMENRGAIYAVDINFQRILLLKENSERMGVKIIYPIVADAVEGFPFKGVKFDRILLDPPCSDLGIIRRHPEIKHRRKREDIERYKGIQMRLMENAVKLLNKKGILVYSVCTVVPEETEDLIKGIIKKGDIVVDDPREFLPESARTLVGKDLFLRIYPHRHGMDGFFAARLKKIR